MLPNREESTETAPTRAAHLEDVPTGNSLTGAPFDLVAADYDRTFTDTPLGQRQRMIVHRYVEPLLSPEFRVLELNCGTGHDALWLAGHTRQVVATDISAEMVAITAGKAARAGLGDRLAPRRLAIEDLRSEAVRRELGTFDLIFSDFDGLNCVADLSWLPDALAEMLAPGGQVLLVFMNPVCLLEILYAAATLRPGRALQRLRPEGIEVHIGDGHRVRTFFHAVGRVKKLFAGRYAIRRIEAVGLTTPPTLMRTVYARFAPLFDLFAPAERLLSPLPPFNRIGDHVMMHLQLREAAR